MHDDGCNMDLFITKQKRVGRINECCSSEKGLALIMVLWVLAVLSVLVLSFAFMARTEVHSTMSFRDGIERKFLAEAGIERGIMELFYRSANKNQTSALEGSEVVRIDGRQYEGEIGDSRYTFSIVDESGKININSLTDANGVILNNLIVNLGLSGDTANTIVDSILDWKDSDNLARLNGAEDAYYDSLSVPYKARNEKFDTLEELLLVKGVSSEILFGSGSRAGLINFLTVYSKGPTVNLNAAAKEVIMALPNMTSSMADRIIEFRQSAELRGQQDVMAIVGDIFRAVAPYVGFSESNVYTVEGKGSKKDESRGYGIRAVVSIEGNNQHHYLYYKSPSDVHN